MIEVYADGDIEKGIRELKRMVKFDNIHPAVAFRLAYVKPSEKRAAKERKAALRRIRAEKRNKFRRDHGGNSRFTHPAGPIG